MAKYMIVRDFDNWTANEVVDASAFVNAQRIRQLVDMRYLTAFVEPVAQDPVPPTSILDATVEQLREMITGMGDVEELTAALELEQRKTAKAIIGDRIAELQSNPDEKPA